MVLSGDESLARPVQPSAEYQGSLNCENAAPWGLGVYTAVLGQAARPRVTRGIGYIAVNDQLVRVNGQSVSAFKIRGSASCVFLPGRGQASCCVPLPSEARHARQEWRPPQSLVDVALGFLDLLPTQMAEVTTPGATQTAKLHVTAVQLASSTM